MNILFLAPHPFYQERGTPIAVNLLLGALSRRGDRVDVVTYHEGADVAIPGVTLHRIPRLPGIRRIPPGFSLKKLACDAFLLWTALRLARRGRYDVVHAVEESAFVAMLIRRLYGIPYIFDMDSSMPRQILEKHPRFGWLGGWMKRMEGRAVRRALVVVPVCDALAVIARENGAARIVLLRDVSLLPAGATGTGPDLRRELGLRGTCFMYIGNLERYQGIDLLLESFACLRRGGTPASLVVVGGVPADVARYRVRAAELGVAGEAHFIGPRPLGEMAALFGSADVLVSPRIQGNNTPMKIYSYLQSGRPVLATDLPTHTQVLTPDVAVLAAPTPDAFAVGMRRLADDPAGARALAARARALADEYYSPAVFERTVNALYDGIAKALNR